MSTPAERLRSARKKKFATATDAASAFGVSKHTYIQHENGTRDFDQDAAAQYARRLGTTPEWILYGRGREAPAEPLVPIVGFVGADSEGRVIFSTGQGTGDMVPLLRPGEEDAVALEVRGSSMGDLAPEGSLIYFKEQRTPPAPSMLGQFVVAELETGEIVVKRLLKGSAPGLFDLWSVSGPLREDVSIVWAAHIKAIIPPYEARQIVVKAGSQAA